MTEHPDFDNYRKCMEEIKRRQIAIDEILDGKKATSFEYTNVEFVALQFRKIFELVILATIASHRHLFEGLTRKLSKEWRVNKIVEIVAKKNPTFYPEPINRVPSDKLGHTDAWEKVVTGFITLDELVNAHGTIGALMHASNPYREEIELDQMKKHFHVWREGIIRLLNHHLVRFPRNDTILYVGMSSKETGGVHTSLFGKVLHPAQLTGASSKSAV